MIALSFIGFGEAGQAFAHGAGWRAFDIDPAKTRTVSLAAALEGATLVLSLVTADQALGVAEQASALITPDTLFCDMNSVAPETKKAAAAAIEAAGGHYVDVAIMAPVNPLQLAVPILLSGQHSDEGAAALGDIGFTNVRIVGDDVGRTSTIKMLPFLIAPLSRQPVQIETWGVSLWNTADPAALRRRRSAFAITH